MSTKTLLSSLRRSRAASIAALASMLATTAAPLVALERPAAARQNGSDPTSDAVTGNMATDGLSTPQASSEGWSGKLSSTDPSTGAARASYPFELPRARGSVQSTLSLEYSSLNGEGDAGVGWRLHLPSIERRSPAGLNVPTFHDYDAQAAQPNWDEYDRFVFDGRPIAPICVTREGTCDASSEAMPSFAATGWWYYRFVVDDGSAYRFFWSPDHRTWVVQTKTETMELGAPLDGRYGDAVDVDDTAGSGAVFRWRLARRYDAAGSSRGVHTNPILYLWSGQKLTDIYDTPLADGGYESLELGGFANHTHLRWRVHPYDHAQPPVWRARTRALLDRVEITALATTALGHRSLVRLYKLNYSSDRAPYSDSHHAKLLGVVQEGRCAAPVIEDPTTLALPDVDPGCPGLPETTFEYSRSIVESPPKPIVAQLAGAPDVLQRVVWNCSDSEDCSFGMNNYNRLAIFDANGDAVPDVMVVPPIQITYFLADHMPKTQQLFVNQHDRLMPTTINLPAPFSNMNASTLSPLGAVAGNWYGDGSLEVLYTGRLPWDRMPAIGSTYDRPPQDSKDGASTLDFAYYALSGTGYGPFTWVSTTSGTWDFRVASDIYQPSYPSIVQANWEEAQPKSSVPGAPIDANGDGLVDFFTAETIWSGGYDDGKYSYVGAGTALAQMDRTGRVTPPFGDGGVIVPAVPTLAGFVPAGKSSPFVTAYQTYEARAADLASRGRSTYSRPYYFADMDGDGLVDAIFPHGNDDPRIATDGTATSANTVDWWRGHGDGAFGEGGCKPDWSGTRTCGYATAHETARIVAPFPMDPDQSDLSFVDVNGDGLADLLIPEDDGLHIRFNVDGTTWSEQEIALRGGAEIPEWVRQDDDAHAYDYTRLAFADMNGSGTEDIVFIGHQVTYVDLMPEGTPNLLTKISSSLGAIETIHYASSATLPFNDVGSSSSHVPQAVQVVTSIDVTNGLPGPNFVAQTTSYDYADPVYDSRERAFRGFRHVTATSDETITKTTYAIGHCPTGPAQPCAESIDDVYSAVSGLPVLTETMERAGSVYLSSEHTTYEVRRLQNAADGRVLRLVYPAQRDKLLYDTFGSFIGSGNFHGFTAIPDVRAVDADDAAKLTDPSQGLPAFLPIRGTAGVAHLRSATHLDDHGNADLATDFGRVVDDSTIAPDADAPITTQSRYATAGPVGSWTWLPSATAVYDGTPSGQDIASIPGARTFTYDPDGNLADVTALLTGSVRLARRHAGGKPFAADPADASHDGPVRIVHVEHTQYGEVARVVRAGGECVDVHYDAAYGAWPVQTTTYVGTGPGECGPTTLDSFESFDPGLGAVVTRSGTSNDVTTIVHDGLGRVAAIYEPDPEIPGVSSSIASTEYFYFPSPTERLMRVNTRSVVDETVVANTRVGTYRQAWTISDAMGRRIAQFDQAEATAQSGAWVVTGEQRVSPDDGLPRQAFAPRFGADDPMKYDGTTIPTQASEAYDYDAFGRMTKRTGRDGVTVLARTAYHALSQDELDGEDLLAGGAHADTPTTIGSDGFGRLATRTDRVKQADGTLDAVTTLRAYRATGELSSVVRTHTAGSERFVRTMIYDSLGRMVVNEEPNTNAGPTGAVAGPSLSAPSFLYAYDDAGRLVGTSDARGCGENLVYDHGGRLVAADFSPCSDDQPDYTEPDLASGDGTEAFYRYDTPEIDQNATPVQTSAAMGRLTSLRDRGQHLRVAYDGRGRPALVQRQIAAPGDAARELASRYAPTWYSVATSYDMAGRVFERSTGADASGLLVGGASTVTTRHSVRGPLASATSSYGPLVNRVQLDADGAPVEIDFADAAHTIATRRYDALRRLEELKVARTPGPWVSIPAPPPSVYSPPPGPGSEQCTSLKPDVYAPLFALLDQARTAAAANASAHPGGDAQSALDALDRAVAETHTAADWQTSVGYDGTNGSTASNVEWWMVDVLDALSAAARSASASAATTASADARLAFSLLTQAAALATTISARGARCYRDDGGLPAGTPPPAPPPSIATCSGLGASALDPLATLVAGAVSSAQAIVAAHVSDPAPYPQLALDYANLAATSVQSLRASLSGQGLTAADGAIAGAMQSALGDVVHDLGYGAFQANIAAGRLGDASSASSYETQASALAYAMAFAGQVGGCFEASSAASSGASSPAPGPSPTFQAVLTDDVITYDLAGNPIKIHDGRPAGTGDWPAGYQPGDRAMTYDDAYRLTGATYAYGADPAQPPLVGVAGAVPSRRLTTRVGSQSFAYDWLGNATSSDDDRHAFFDRSLGTITSASSAPNRLESAVGPTGSLAARYDAAGELVSLTVKRSGSCAPEYQGACTQRFDYSWDEVGRLARAQRWDFVDEDVASGATSPDATPYPALPSQAPAADLRFAYGADNHRVVKAVTTLGAAPTYDVEIFDSLRLDRAPWDGADYRHDEATESVYLPVDGALVARVAYAEQDWPSASSGKVHVLFELGDALGSMTTVIDQGTGELVERATYQAYGQDETDYRPDRWEGFRETHRFTGKELDAEVGLTYFGQRYYSAPLGRWISADPLAVHGATGDLNPYAYVAGHATSAVDPNGLCIEPSWDMGGNVGGSPCPSQAPAAPQAPPSAPPPRTDGPPVTSRDDATRAPEPSQGDWRPPLAPAPATAVEHGGEAKKLVRDKERPPRTPGSVPLGNALLHAGYGGYVSFSGLAGIGGGVGGEVDAGRIYSLSAPKGSKRFVSVGGSAPFSFVIGRSVGFSTGFIFVWDVEANAGAGGTIGFNNPISDAPSASVLLTSDGKVNGVTVSNGGVGGDVHAYPTQTKQWNVPWWAP